jgi:hypothetical protein
MLRCSIRLNIFVLMICAQFIVAGCSKATKQIPMGQVNGTITVDGEPVAERCQVQFVSKNGVVVGLASVRAGGEYTLTAAGSPNIPADEYLIQILPPPRSKEEEKAEKDKFRGLMVQAAMNIKDNKPIPEIPRWSQEEILPRKYWETSTSQLKFTVKAEVNTANFELTKKQT